MRGWMPRLAGVLLLLLVTPACASAEPSASLQADTVVIDVRTAEEFASGHLEGAQNLDLNSGEFEAALPDLSPTANYLVYCRSGNRSAQAVSLMEAAGFKSVQDGGGLDDAAASTGLEIVTESE